VRAFFALFAASLAWGQTATDRLEFEVASVRRAAPDAIGGAMLGGPETADPERITYVNVRLAHLISIAYARDFDQISGPAWIESEKYDVTAKVRPGATKQQAQEMWRNLLAERFHLTLHHTTKEFPGYELVVAKNGPKLKESTGGNEATGRHYLEAHPNSHASRLTFRDATMSDLVQRLGWPLGSWAGGGIAMGRVEDGTGLTGKYDFTLKFSGLMIPGGAFSGPTVDDQEDDGPALFPALESQLGLKLENTKLLLDVLVIDQVDKVPTEN
jgi:uncharacterized protein (TIGR03435 family)